MLARGGGCGGGGGVGGGGGGGFWGGGGGGGVGDGRLVDPDGVALGKKEVRFRYEFGVAQEEWGLEGKGVKKRGPLCGGEGVDQHKKKKKKTQQTQQKKKPKNNHKKKTHNPHPTPNHHTNAKKKKQKKKNNKKKKPKKKPTRAGGEKRVPEGVFHLSLEGLHTVPLGSIQRKGPKNKKSK